MMRIRENKKWSLRFYCPHCQKLIVVASDGSFMIGVCPECKKLIGE